tara:strand:+ start:23701 stop:24651 length:951 start_codon:yes stop_codon:yes gene_type:complete
LKNTNHTTKVLFYSKWDSIKEWQKVFDKENIKLINWPSDFKNKKHDIKYAIVWDAPNTLWKQFPNIKLIQSLGAGIDHILLKNYPKNSIITRLEDPDLTNQMTEYSILAVLMCYRKYFQYSELKNKIKWKQLTPLKKNEFKVTVLGYGIIAKNIIKELSKLGFNINVWASKKRELKHCKYYYGSSQFLKSVKNSNCLLNLLPNTSKTKGLINLSVFKLLNKESYFINIGRGKTVIEKELIYALKNNILTGSILDVFKNEPLIKSNELWKLKNVFISPHIAGITNATNYAAKIFKNNINAMTNQKYIKNKVSIKKQY